jgi:hypothetical protein
MSDFSFTKHPASVGEDYFTHLRHALGFGVSMIGGRLACSLHAVFPFWFTKTGSGGIATLHTKMITKRRAQSVARPVGRRTAKTSAA